MEKMKKCRRREELGDLKKERGRVRKSRQRRERVTSGKNKTTRAREICPKMNKELCVSVVM